MNKQAKLQDKIDAIGAWDIDTKLNIHGCAALPSI